MYLRERLFLICGEDSLKRRQAETGIKKKISRGGSLSLNTITIYAKELEKKIIPESVTNSYFGGNNLIIFKDFLNLSPSLKSFILENLVIIIKDSFIIFETDKNLYQVQIDKKVAADSLFKLVLDSAIRFRVDSFTKTASIELFMDNIRKNNFRGSVDVLEELFKNNPSIRVGPQILGMLIKKISYITKNKRFPWMKDGVTKRDCLEYLYQADRQIKEKGLSDRLVIETLMGKMFQFDPA